MAYRKIANWLIDMGGVKEATGWRQILGVDQYSENIGIKFQDKEFRTIIRSSDLTILSEIEQNIIKLAHVRYSHHHRFGTGNDYGRPSLDDEISDTLENLGVHLPGWLR